MRIVISTGLMIDINYIRCIGSFNAILVAKGHKKPDMQAWQAMMPAILQVDDEFKNGKINEAEFQTKIENIVSQQIEEEIKLEPKEFISMWNEMIKGSSSTFNKKLQALIEAGHTPILISGINSIHFAYLQKTVVDCALVLQSPAGEEFQEETLQEVEVQKEKTYSVYATYAYQKTKLELYDIILKNCGDDEIVFILSSTKHIPIPAAKEREDNFNRALNTYAQEKDIPTIEIDPAEDIVDQIEHNIREMDYQRQLKGYKYDSEFKLA